MPALRTEQELYHTYLVLEPEENPVKENYTVHILQNNTLNFFLPFQLRSRDGVSSYYYDVPSDESLKKQLEKGFREEQLENFAAGLVNALDEVEDYLLDENDLFLNPSGIFMTESGEYRFIYCPGYHMDFSTQLQNLAALFLKYVDYTCAGAVQHVYNFYHMTCRENTSIKNLREFKLKFGEDMGSRKKAGSSPTPDVKETSDSGMENKPSEDKEMFSRTDAFQNPYEKSSEEKNSGLGEAEENKNSLGWTLAAACGAEAGIGAVVVKLLNVPVVAGAIAVGMIIAITAVALLGFFFFSRQKKQEDDFWKPEDYVPPFFAAERGADTGENDGKTTVLSSKMPGIRLRSKDPRIWGDLYILNFPAVIGKETADTCGKIDLPTVSRRHARIERMGDTFYLTDLRSSNGTYINGEMIEPLSSVGLHSGDSVIFSDVEFTFEILEQKG